MTDWPTKLINGQTDEVSISYRGFPVAREVRSDS